MSDIEGRKAIVLISSGIDTFSKLTYDKTRKKLQEAGVPIYAIGLMQACARWTIPRYMGAIAAHGLPAGRQPDAHVRQGDWRPGVLPALLGRVRADLPDASPGAAQPVRPHVPAHQTKHDGKFRKIKVELVNPATNEPLPVKDEKGKPIKYPIVAKTGYRRRAQWNRRSLRAH